ncbi:unnamed protein product [Sphagnum troendelagicum]|uniref:Uncharacterized protein n=1 Tax=Sphagnum troendelagicum TaxID=128251 RepID=A0ABP0TGT5_9BRYO
MSDIKLMMMAGGFSASPYLMKRVRDTFIQYKVEEVISPPNPGSATVTAISLSLFSSSQNPRYSTNEGTVLEGTMVDDMFKDLELGSDREVEVSMFFGCTSI